MSLFPKTMSLFPKTMSLFPKTMSLFKNSSFVAVAITASQRATFRPITVFVNCSDFYKSKLLASTTTAQVILRITMRLTQCPQALLRAAPALV